MRVLPNATKSKLDVTTDLQAFGLIVTAEPYFAVTKPSDVVDRKRDKKRHGRKNRGNRREV